MNKLRNLRNSNDGVAGIIVALLMIGLLFSAIGFVQTSFVPMWMEQKEAEHMDEVAKQFSQLKFGVDTLSLSAKQQSSLLSPITLGCKEMPIWSTSRAFGSLQLLPDDFEIIFTTTGGIDHPYSIGVLEYKSNNNYFVQQSYIYECGAVVLSQDKGDVIFLEPNVIVNDADMIFDLMQLNNMNGNTAVSGFGTYPVRTIFTQQNSENYQIDTITIYNTHLDAWEEFFQDLFEDNTVISITTSYTADSKGIVVNFDQPINLTINENIVGVKITPGYFK